MTKIKNFSQQKPILFSLAVCVITYLCMRISSLIFSFLPDNMLWDYIREPFDILWPVALTILFGFRFIYNPKRFGSTLIVGMPVFVFGIFMIIVSYLEAVLLLKVQWQTFSVILLSILSLIDVGIREEVIFRGVIANSLAFKYGTDKKGLWFAVIVSSLMFGCVHFTNLFHGVKPLGLIAQIVGAFSAGMLYTAIYLRGGNIWVLVLFHVIENASGLFKSSFTVTALTKVDQVSNMNLVGTLVLLCIHVCLTLFLLRKSKRPAIFARLEQLRTQYNQNAVLK